MKLVDVYEGDAVRDGVADQLYVLLRDRPPEASISHRGMPSWDEHVAFVESLPYAAWFLVEIPFGLVAEETIGCVYLTNADEIGVFLFERHRGKGFGPKAIKLLMEACPRERYLANVAPANAQSARMFVKMGFRQIQNTYELRPHA